MFAGTGLRYQAHRIRAAGGIPFLHVKTDNATAIKVYRALEFMVRSEMSICIIQPVPA